MLFTAGAFQDPTVDVLQAMKILKMLRRLEQSSVRHGVWGSSRAMFFFNKVGYAVRRNAHRKWCLNSIINDGLLDHWNVGRGTVEFVICH